MGTVAVANTSGIVDEAQFDRFLSILYPPGQPPSCVEFRALNCVLNKKTGKLESSPYHITMGGWFDKPDHLKFECRRLEQVSGYVTVNPVDPVFLSRAPNVLTRIDRGEGTKIENILCVRHLIIDIDVERPVSGISATPEEVAEALEVRDRILHDHPAIRDHAHWGCSGNGAWILLRLPDLPNEEAYRNKTRSLLHSLADRYGSKDRGDRVHIDTNTKNPNRHLGIPGTLKCKGANLAPRTWRMVTIDS